MSSHTTQPPDTSNAISLATLIRMKLFMVNTLANPCNSLTRSALNSQRKYSNTHTRARTPTYTNAQIQKAVTVFKLVNTYRNKNTFLNISVSARNKLILLHSSQTKTSFLNITALPFVKMLVLMKPPNYFYFAQNVEKQFLSC